MKEKIRTIILAFVLPLSITGQVPRTDLCPFPLNEIFDTLGKNCSTIQCNTKLSKEMCPVGSILEERIALCGCCPACVEYFSEYKEKCDPNGPNDEYKDDCTGFICPVVKQCKRGLECKTMDGLNANCEPLDIGINGENRCWIKKASIERDNLKYSVGLDENSPPLSPLRDLRHLPNCNDEDGSFAPVQCKGEPAQGICFCSDRFGRRIFGNEIYAFAENMTCGCSVRMNDLRNYPQNSATGLTSLATLHCKSNGDYESLQCDVESGLCFCVDEMTGKTTGEIVIESQFRYLSCYNASLDEYAGNGSYLRRCESEWVAAEKLEREASLHALSYYNRLISCDYDGGFAPAHRTTTGVGQEFCVYRGGPDTAGNTLPYQRIYTVERRMDCQCARDNIFYELKGYPVRQECERNDDPDSAPPGSYLYIYNTQQVSYCVDTDGYQFGPDVPNSLACCLDGNEDLGNLCDQETKPICDENDFKLCKEYEYGREEY